MPAPSPHSGPCRRSGDGARHDAYVTALGRYRGLCGVCRPIVAAEQKSRKRAGTPGPAPLSDERAAAAIVPDKSRPRLSKVVRDLAPAAEALETACERRRLATDDVRVAVASFRETLRVVQDVAQSLLNATAVRHAAATAFDERAARRDRTLAEGLEDAAVALANGSAAAPVA